MAREQFWLSGDNEHEKKTDKRQKHSIERLYFLFALRRSMSSGSENGVAHRPGRLVHPANISPPLQISANLFTFTQ